MFLMATYFILLLPPGFFWWDLQLNYVNPWEFSYLLLTVNISGPGVLFSDYASKLSLAQIIAIVVACIGLVCLVVVALVIRTFMKTKTKRGSRKIHVRKMPQDYNMVIYFDTCRQHLWFEVENNFFLNSQFYARLLLFLALHH